VTIALGALAAILALTDWYTVAVGRRRIEAWAKPATMLLVTAATLSAGAFDQPAGRWLVAALLLGLVGDVALLGDDASRFVVGLVAFMLGHLAYIVCFIALGVSDGWWMVGGSAVVIVALVAGRGILPGAARTGGRGLASAVATYMAVIGAMTITGWATGAPLVAVGTMTFVASDLTLALARFVPPPRSWGRVVVMVTYHLGQALIAAGVLLAV
jgi:uncharacterized membrane protein YhhN